MRYRSTYLLGLLCTIFLVLGSTKVVAESLSVSLRVGNTRVTFAGYSSPSAYLTVKQNSVTLGSTSADSSGNFSKTIYVDNPGINAFTLTSTDTQNRPGTPISYSLNLTEGAETTVTNIVTSPTISLTTSPTFTGDTFTLSGLTHPNSSVVISLSDGSSSTATPNSAGVWSSTLQASSQTGTYSVQATATLPGSLLSLASPALTYSLAAAPTPSPSPSLSSPIPSLIPSITPSPVSSASASLTPLIPVHLASLSYDTNRDGLIAVSELTVVIKSWILDWKNFLSTPNTSHNSSPTKCDINKNGSCDLTDLSILLYYVERK